MPDETVDILLRTQGDTAGAEKVTGAVDETTAATRRSVPAQEEAGKAAEKHGSAHRELHRLMHQVTEESPILGLAMRAVFSPLGAIIMGVVMAIQYYKTAIEDAKKKAEEMGKKASESFGDMKESMHDAHDETEKQQLAFDEWTRSFDKSTKAVNEALDLEMVKVKAIAEQYERILAAKKDTSIAEVREKLREGKISPELAAVQEAGIETAYTRDVRGAKAGAMAKEKTETEAALRSIKDQEAASRAKAEALKTESETEMALQKDLPKRIAKLKESAPELAQAYAEASSKAEGIPEVTNRTYGFVGANQGTLDIANARKRKAEEEANLAKGLVDSNREATDRAEKALSALNHQHDVHVAALNAAEAKTKDLDGQMEALTKHLQLLEVQVKAINDAAPAIAAQEKRQAALKMMGQGQGGLIEASDAARQVQEGEAAKKRAALGYHLSPEEQAAIARESRIDPKVVASITYFGDRINETFGQIMAGFHAPMQKNVAALVALSTDVAAMNAAMDKILAERRKESQAYPYRTMPGGNP